MKKILGIVEGYYGRPWSFDQRKRVITKIAQWGYNTYVYAPKHDLYHRNKWMEPYPENIFNSIIDLANFSKEKGIDFYYTISPGKNFSYTSNEDFNILLNKLKCFYNKGVRFFGILFDDIPSMFIHEEDKKNFNSLENAQNSLLHKCYNEIKKWDVKNSILTCPTQYFGRGNEAYIKEFCYKLPEDLFVFWTGREVLSQALSGPDTQFFIESTGHRPLYWDNYPVNDSSMKWEMHLGPYKHRDYEILDYSDGIVLNVMEYPEASLISLKTASDFFKMRKTYDPMISWDHAINELIPEPINKYFKIFAFFNFKSIIYPYFSNFNMVWELINKVHLPDWDYKKYITELLEQSFKSYEVLSKHKDLPIIREVYPWLKKFKIVLSYLKYYFLIKDKKRLLRFFYKLRLKYYYKKFLLDHHEIFQLELLNFILIE